MRKLSVLIFTTIALLAINPAFAGRDASQLMLLQNQTNAMQVEQLAKEKQTQQGLAGPTGIKGQIGPGGQSKTRVRNPAFHP